MNGISVIKYLFAIVGLVLLLVAFLTYRNTQDFLKESISANGEVVELVRSRKSSSNNKRTYKPVVVFQTQNGKMIEFTSSTASSPPRYSVGESVEVFYRELAPSEARIKEHFSLWGATLVSGGLGGILSLIAFSLILHVFWKNRTIRYLKEHGVPVRTRFQSVEINTSVAMNDRNPYRIYTQWINPATSDLHVFSSENIWFDPTDFIHDTEITVLVEKDNPEKYYVDTSFLPGLK